jgi:hypothetical protein
MKTAHTLLILSLFILSKAAISDPKQRMEWIQPTEEAQRLSAEFLGTLKAQLIKKIQADGPVAAFEYCSDNAPGLGKEFQKKLPSGWSIKRVSDKNRNLNNKADALDLEAIKFFSDPKNSKVPFVWLDEEPLLASRYYKPIRIEGTCLLCHGEPARMQEKVVEGLKTRYPQDQALGYAAGDLRGVAVIRVPRSKP